LAKGAISPHHDQSPRDISLMYPFKRAGTCGALLYKTTSTHAHRDWRPANMSHTRHQFRVTHHSGHRTSSTHFLCLSMRHQGHPHLAPRPANPRHDTGCSDVKTSRRQIVGSLPWTRLPRCCTCHWCTPHASPPPHATSHAASGHRACTRPSARRTPLQPPPRKYKSSRGMS